MVILRTFFKQAALPTKDQAKRFPATWLAYAGHGVTKLYLPQGRTGYFLVRR